MDDETQHYIAIRRIKLEQLRILDEQAAKYGDLAVPPHVKMEQGSLRDELTIMESAIKAPARSSVGDELGAGGRFLVYHQQNREIRQSIAAVAVQLETFIADSKAWRSMHRQWLLIIGVVVVIILIVVVALVTYLATKGTL